MARSHSRIVPSRAQWPAAGSFAMLLAILVILALVVATTAGAQSLMRTCAQASAVPGWWTALSTPVPSGDAPHAHHAVDAAPQMTHAAGAQTPHPVSSIPDDRPDCCTGPCPACIPALAPAAGMRPLPALPASHPPAKPLLRAGLIPSPALDPPRPMSEHALI